MRRSLAILPLLILPTHAWSQDVEVIGRQTPVELYNAPVLSSEIPEGAIDFPSLISAPGANDTAVIIDSVSALNLLIVDRDGDSSMGEFVSIHGQSRAEQDSATLYANIREVLAVYRDLPLTLGDIRFIQQDITDAYRMSGFPLMSVVVPPQEIENNSLTVQINEFRLSGVNLSFGDGNGGFSETADHWSSEDRIVSNLQKLTSEPILRQQSLDREVRNLNLNPFRSARLVFEPGTEIGQTIANIQLEEQRPWNMQMGYNNYATEASGTNRYSVGGTIGNLPMEDQQISWNVTLGDRFDEFNNYSLIYTVPNRFGHTFSLNANYSDTASSTIPGIDSASTSTQLTASYSYPLIAGDNWDVSGDTSLSVKQFERASLFGGVEVGGAEFDSVQLSTGFTLNLSQENASNQISASIINSFEGVTGNNTLDNFERFHNSVGGEPDYQLLVLNYARMHDLSSLGERWEGWRTETQASIQYAADELAGSDNFAMGGSNVLRAYEASAAAGDRGWFVSQLVHIPTVLPTAISEVLKDFQWAAFLETGSASFENGGEQTLWDIGVTTRFGLPKNLGCSASLAVVGKSTFQADRGDTQFFASCSVSI